jgi:hypothetical protein
MNTIDTIDTRDLAEKREELKKNIFEALEEEMPELVEEFVWVCFDDIDFEDEKLLNFKSKFDEELNEIEEIDEIERVLGEEFKYGETLVNQDDFEEYVEDLCEELGYIPKDFPDFLLYYRLGRCSKRF